ncbi:hypothetical protein AB1Y20_021801 [Prymnesium parvum]|uniref:Secreted protein n=1 Tax=Prymnesium parvum TaxID=97485 RepID=A0AB34JLM7_PRYPA
MRRALVLLVSFLTATSSLQAVKYEKRHSGYCDDGWSYLDSPEECAEAAVAVGTKCQDCQGAHKPEARADRPKGCRAWIGPYCCAHWNLHPDPTPVREPDTPEHVVGWAAVCKKSTEDHREL